MKIMTITFTLTNDAFTMMTIIDDGNKNEDYDHYVYDNQRCIH